MAKRKVSLFWFHIIVGLTNSLFLSLIAYLVYLPFSFPTENIAFWILVGVNIFGLIYYIVIGFLARRMARDLSLRLIALRPATWLAILLALSIGGNFDSFALTLVCSFPFVLLARSGSRRSVVFISDKLEQYVDVSWITPEPVAGSKKKMSLSTMRIGYLYLIFPILVVSLIIGGNLLHFDVGLAEWDLISIRVFLWALALALLVIVWVSEFNTKLKGKLSISSNERASYILRLAFQITPSVYGLVDYFLGGPQIDLIGLCALSFASIVLFQLRLLKQFALHQN
jgi:hypothetical protein